MYSYGVVIRLFTLLSFDAQHDCAIRADEPWSAFILLTDHAKAAIYLGSGCAVSGLQVDWDLLTGLFDGTDTRPFTWGGLLKISSSFVPLLPRGNAPLMV